VGVNRVIVNLRGNAVKKLPDYLEPDELDALPAIEVAADALFRTTPYLVFTAIWLAAALVPALAPPAGETGLGALAKGSKASRVLAGSLAGIIPWAALSMLLPSLRPPLPPPLSSP